MKINGSTSGSVTLAAPATGSDVTVTLPATAGTIPLSASATLSDPTFTGNVIWSGGTLRVAAADVTTSQTTTSTTYTDLATAGPSVTLTTGTKALVILSATMYASGAAETRMSFSVSGASTIAVDDKWALWGHQQTAGSSRAYLLTGLTAGSNTFTAKYNVSSGSVTGYFVYRSIAVIDMGS